ncbi:hypothetical protein FHG87_022564, partial [Trinorchestia longiramus]
ILHSPTVKVSTASRYVLTGHCKDASELKIPRHGICSSDRRAGRTVGHRNSSTEYE